MISYWLYDAHKNEVFKQNVDLDEVHFMRSTDPDFFLIKEEAQFITVQATNSESMTMKSDSVTPEQIVILFSTIRGLRDQAAD